MNTRNQLLCAHSTILFCLLVGVGGFLVTGWLPPPSPDLAPDDVARIFSPDNFVMRLGVSLVALGAPLFITFSVAVSAQMRRIEGENHVLSYVQMLAGAIGVLAIQFPAYFWLVISFHPDTPKEIIVVFNNLSFFLLLAAYSPALMQNLTIGICILSAKDRKNSYPRWLGFASLWLSLALLPGIVVPFFTHGPFSYSGLFGFWVVANGFFVWVLLMYWQTVKAIKRQAALSTAPN